MTVEYPMMHESVWFDQAKFEKAEAEYQVHLVQTKYGTNSPAVAATETTETTVTTGSSNLVNEIARARQQIQTSLNTTTGGATSAESTNRMDKLEKENQDLRKLIEGLTTRIQQIELRVGSGSAVTTQGGTPDTDDGFVIVDRVSQEAPSKPAAKDDSDDDDDDDDLFGSEDEEELERIREERAIAAQKAIAASGKKKVVIAKSSVLLDIKGYDDQTPWPAIEKLVRNIEMKGLVWGASKLVDVVYGVKKLQILSTIVDDEVSVEELSELIEEIDDVQSVDIAAFNKV